VPVPGVERRRYVVPTPPRAERSGFAESEESFHEQAIQEVGCDDFGDPSYLEGLRVLLQAYDREAKLTPIGRTVARHGVLEVLKNRLRAERAWKEDPSILEIEIRRPIVILGLVRTGSTALHYLMGQDPDLQVLQYWLASHPKPRPPRREWEGDPYFEQAVAELEGMYAVDDKLRAIHNITPEGPEECRHLLAQHFTDDGFEVCTTIPSYSEWYEKKHMDATYARHRKLVQWIGSTDRERPWLLKYPVHMRNLRELLSVYPDACIVQTHRDPTKVMPSYCSLMAGFGAIYEDDFDVRAMAERQMDLWAAGAEEAIEFRRGRDSTQFFDLHFREFMADPVGSVKRIYGHFGRELSNEGERRLRAWQESNPQHKHGKHDYEADVGVVREKMLERFGAYMDFFGMQPE
jgi:hypothetical protein